MQYKDELARQTIRLIADHSGLKDGVIKTPLEEAVKEAQNKVDPKMLLRYKDGKYNHVKYALFDVLVEKHTNYYEGLAERVIEDIYTSNQVNSMKNN